MVNGTLMPSGTLLRPLVAKPRKSQAVWEKIRALWERGEAQAELCRTFGVSDSALYARKKSEGWERLKPRGRGKHGSQGGAASEAGLPSQPVSLDSEQNALFSPDSDLPALQKVQESASLPSLIPATQGTPEDFQTGLARYAETLLALGAPSIEPPKTIAELKTLNDVIRKARGMDAKDKGGQVAGLVKPMRTLSRRAVVVDLEPVEDDGMECG